jgi:hypothetical protein
MKWSSLLTVAAFCAACGGGPAVEQVNPEAAAAPEAAAEAAGAGTGGILDRAAAAVGVPRYREVTVPAGTTLRLALRSSVASDTSQVEDTVRAELSQPVTVDGLEVIPAGADVTGNVTAVERSGRVKGRASVAYQFDTVSVAGEELAIRTAPVSHLAPATKGEDATKIGVGAGIGAAIGGILGGGDGAAKGAAIGGAGGTGVVLATRGEEVRRGPGADVSTRLTSPVTLRIRVD